MAPQRAPRTVDELMELLYSGQGAQRAPDRPEHPGHLDPPDLHQHALQIAALLRRSRPSDKELQVAGLVQDIGLLLHPDGSRASVTDDAATRTDAVADCIQLLLGGRVARLVRLHTPAERFLATREPGRELSPWASRTAGARGRVMAAAEAEAFARDPLAEDAVTLRQAAEAALVPGLDAGVLEDWRPVLALVAADRAAPPPRPAPGRAYPVRH
ncbi:metal-dependent phosphohydrolase [Streptomyces boluensis]|uniref:Metal-dependent phosphohydrolase n=1 Tax=Streptomyces boluensis TaxID=1775135 RepID=A0A964UXY0_9ACTN|nr:metal-dependent phosphohydrolase [Streptomyces boluensis]NBE56353.1 metal-dependent phosphohydrolase [Streptomyces boluensis]